MLIHSKLAQTEVNGPGRRAIVWVAGCTLACAGCWNQETWAFDDTKSVPAVAIAEWLSQQPGIEGITFSGGEPLQQAGQLYVVFSRLRELRPDLSIGIYTGYTLKELEEGRYRWRRESDAEWEHGTPELWAEIRKHLDFAVMGRFNQAKLSIDKPMCGSSNQDVVFFSDRYTEKDLKPQAVEVHINPDGLVQITGFPSGVDLNFGKPRAPQPKPALPSSAGNDDESGDLVAA